MLKGDDDDDDDAAPRVWAGGRRRRHPEVRRQIQTEDDDHINLPSPLGSQSSSADGIYPSGRTSHPFRVVEHDAASVQSSISLGKVSVCSLTFLTSLPIKLMIQVDDFFLQLYKCYAPVAYTCTQTREASWKVCINRCTVVFLETYETIYTVHGMG